MGLAETANLLVNLTLKDGVSAPAAKMKTGLGDFGKVALGVAGAAGFGALTKGALEAQDAQGKFMAATGQSREEAKQFVSGLDGLAGSAGTVGMKFEDLAALGTTVEQQFGTTGQKTIDLTENIAEFARVTGTDADGAAGDLEDTLSAYGLTADDAAGFTDQLVASAQKYGTETGPAQLDILRKISPALQTMGGDLTDGVGFLNLFETAGLDAGTAAAGLNKAVKELKPGQSLDDLIAQVGSIEDPTLRAQKAIELFGTKAGPALASAIKPGTTSLDDFKVSTEEAQGATKKAAEGMVTDADKIRGVFDKLQAGAREVGQNFGPAITGIASLASLATPFASGMKDMFSKVLAQVLPSATAQGVEIAAAQAAGASGTEALGKWTNAGKIAGNALKLGIIAGVGLVVVDVMVQQVDAAKEEIKNDPNKVTPDDMFNMRAPMWAGAKLAAAKGMQDIGQSSLEAFNKAWDEGIAAGMGPNDPALLNSARQAGLAVSGVFEHDSRPLFQDAATSLVRTFGDTFDHDSRAPMLAAGKTAAKTVGSAFAVSPEWMATSRKAAEKITEAFNDKVLSERGNAEDAWDAFVNMMKHPLDTAAELAELKGDLASKKMIKGLSSNDPQTRAWAENTRDTIENRINDLTQLLAQDGTDASNALGNHLDSGPAAAAAREIMRKIEAALHDVTVNIKVNKYQDPGHVPGGGRAEGGPVKKGVAYIVGERRPELFVPDANGTIIPRLPPMSQPSPYHGAAAMPQMALAVNVQLSTRAVDREISHYNYIQGRTR